MVARPWARVSMRVSSEDRASATITTCALPWRDPVPPWCSVDKRRDGRRGRSRKGAGGAGASDRVPLWCRRARRAWPRPVPVRPETVRSRSGEWNAGGEKIKRGNDEPFPLSVMVAPPALPTVTRRICFLLSGSAVKAAPHRCACCWLLSCVLLRSVCARRVDRTRRRLARTPHSRQVNDTRQRAGSRVVHPWGEASWGSKEW
jgi:hypothetical protein